MTANQIHRPRRNRKSENLRKMVAETNMTASQLVLPIFVMEGTKGFHDIKSMPGIQRETIDHALLTIDKAMKLGIVSVALFPYIEEKKRDERGREGLNSRGLVPRAIRKIKDKFPDLVVFADVALDPFSSMGHDGLVVEGEIVNDPTVDVLAQMAKIFGEAGADFVAPSDMMDGRVAAIRKSLDSAGLTSVGIMSYAAKYASGFYGPFRDALDSAPRFGDKKTYQMDYRNTREALREVQLDLEEGADMVMVKPALSYLDIIYRIKEISSVPVAAYNVSGEYAMIKAAAKNNWIDETKTMVESLFSMRRAGADLIFTYFAIEMAAWLKKNTF